MLGNDFNCLPCTTEEHLKSGSRKSSVLVLIPPHFEFHRIGIGARFRVSSHRLPQQSARNWRNEWSRAIDCAQNRPHSFVTDVRRQLTRRELRQWLALIWRPLCNAAAAASGGGLFPLWEQGKLRRPFCHFFSAPVERDWAMCLLHPCREKTAFFVSDPERETQTCWGMGSPKMDGWYF